MFDYINFIVCIIETVSMLLFRRIIDYKKFKITDYLIAFVLLIASSVIVTFIDGISYAILPINFAMLFLCFWCGFRRKISETFFSALISFTGLIYLQSFAMSIIPSKLLASNRGNFFIDGFVIIVAITLVIIANHFNFAKIYENNIKFFWVYLSTLCVPSIVIAQFFTMQAEIKSSSSLIILFMLQLVYITLTVLFFIIIRNRSNRQQYKVTQKYIDELNNHLDDSRKSAHDFNKHIRFLRNTIELEAQNKELVEKVNNYCNELMEKYNNEEILLQLDNPVFRALIYGRYSQAAQNDIDFILNSSPVLPNFPIKNYQMVEIFDNLMDNAFDCVTTLGTLNKWIRTTLNVTKNNDGAFVNTLCIENPYDDIDFSAIISENAYTSKGGIHKGLGLKKVSQLVKSTGGMLTLNNQNNVFTAKIMYIIHY